MNMTDSDEQREGKRKGLGAILVTSALAATLCAGGVVAYLTATDSKTNDLTIAEKLAITVVEPNWDLTDEDENGIPDAAEGILPGQTVAKDPSIRNETNIDSYAIMQVQIPTKEVKLGDEENASLRELFIYDINDGWSEHGPSTYDSTSAMTTHTYFYDSVLAGNATTIPLFNEVTLADLVNDQLLGDTEKSIEIIGHAIQALGFDDCAAAWSAYQAQNAH